MEDGEEPIRIPITDIFDLHSVQPKEVADVVQTYVEEANRLGLKMSGRNGPTSLSLKINRKY